MIELDRVSVRLSREQALRDLSLALRPGVTLIHGPSGAGKSTLLRIVATLLSPDQGRVRYPWENDGPGGLDRLRAHIGYVPQESRLTQTLSCVDALRYLAAVRGLPGGRRDVESLLARWGLWPVRARRLDRLSAGEARRWLLAQSQLASPDLWVLDEPLRALDAEAVQTLRAELALYATSIRTGLPRFALVAAQDSRLDDIARQAVHLDRGRIAQP